GSDAVLRRATPDHDELTKLCACGSIMVLASTKRPSPIMAILIDRGVRLCCGFRGNRRSKIHVVISNTSDAPCAIDRIAHIGENMLAFDAASRRLFDDRGTLRDPGIFKSLGRQHEGWHLEFENRDIGGLA